MNQNFIKFYQYKIFLSMMVLLLGDRNEIEGIALSRYVSIVVLVYFY